MRTGLFIGEFSIFGVAHGEESSVCGDGDPGWCVWVAEASFESLRVVCDHVLTFEADSGVGHSLARRSCSSMTI